MKQKSLAVQHPEDETQPFVWSACWALWRQNGPEAAWMPQQLLSVCGSTCPPSSKSHRLRLKPYVLSHAGLSLFACFSGVNIPTVADFKQPT